MAPLKPVFVASGIAFALSTLSPPCSGDSCETGDQTALLQSHLSRKSELSLSQTSSSFFPKLANLNDPKTRKTALLEMEKTAIELANMDKSQATDVVITVCTETAELLNTTVLYSIIEEDAADRASLETAYAPFADLEQQRQDAEDQLDQAEAVVTSKAQALAQCRETETQTCIDDDNCENDVDTHCMDRDRLELELQEIDAEIHNSWCESGAVRTHTTFRTETVEVFKRYSDKWTELEIAQGLCDNATERCAPATQTYIDTAFECNLNATALQMASCSYHHVASGALKEYQDAFISVRDFYNTQVARVQVMEADRKVEWDVLTRVICLLLTLTNEDDGVVSSDETAARIERCWTDDVDTTHLDIEYLDPPPMLGLPELPPLPCEADHIGGVDLAPPAVCTELIHQHNTQSTSVCSCLADELSDQGMVLGFFLLVDPALDVVVDSGHWSIQQDDMVITGELSQVHSQDFSALTSSMLTDAEMDPTSSEYTGPIAKMVWAYPSQHAPAAGASGQTLAQRFISRGGLLFLNADDQVIDVRQLSPSSDALNQPPSATLSFSSAETVTDEQATAACPNMQPVTDEEYLSKGATTYCWVMGSVGLPQCVNGCFIFDTVSGKVAFPVMDGLHLYHSP